MSEDYVPRRGDWCAVNAPDGTWHLWRVLRVRGKKDYRWGYAPISHVAPYDGVKWPLPRANQNNKIGVGHFVFVRKISKQSDRFAEIANREFHSAEELRHACDQILKGDK